MRRVLVAVAATAALLLGATRADATVVGASGDVESLRSQVTGQLAIHAYGVLNKTPVTDARYVNIQPADGQTWAGIAAGNSDAQVIAWADALKAVGKNRMVTFSHEPMVDLGVFGDAAGFVAAWRHVHDVFAARGATNVEWVWNTSGASWGYPLSNPKSAPLWWPGNRWVDDVSSESFNRNTCHSDHPWQSFAAPLIAPLEFARAHSKQLLVGEFGSNGPTNRVSWLDHATHWLVAHRNELDAVFYYDSPHPDDGGCVFTLTSQAEFDAITRMIGALR